MTYNHYRTRAEVPTWKQLAFGATAGYVLWIFIYPIDAIKSKLQTDALDPSKRAYSSAIDCLRKTVKAQGYKGLWKGFGTCMLRAGYIVIVTLTIGLRTQPLLRDTRWQ